MSGFLLNAAFVLYVLGLLHSVVAFVSKKNVFLKVAVASVIVGFVLHSGFLVYHGAEEGHFPLTNLRETLAFFAWTVSLCFLISHLRYRVTALGPFLLPVVAALMLGTALLESAPAPTVLSGSWIYFHTIFLFLAYAMFAATFIAALLYLFQERELKTKKPKTFYYQLPSLVKLDDLFLRFLISGFCFMSVGLLVGLIWARQDWIQGWQKDPTVVVAGATWAIYLLLIYLRLTVGWRGRRAAVISMIGFFSVLLTFAGASYFGNVHSFLVDRPLGLTEE